VNLIGHIRDLVGEKNFDIEIEDHTLRGLIRKISTVYGKDLMKSIVKQQTQEFFVLILVNGMDVDFLKKLDTPLKDGDRIDIIPPVAGG